MLVIAELNDKTHNRLIEVRCKNLTSKLRLVRWLLKKSFGVDALITEHQPYFYVNKGM